ncbi:MAG TPA: cysteine--tRNA ligase [bacterium]|nr:cysteine--tRNA ligase [bacterium]
MSLKVYNTIARDKEPFQPLRPGRVGMYVCGVTVYDECHLGHARVYVAFDVVKRYLEYKGYAVTYVRNVTDVDDKIIEKARSLGQTDLVAATREITAKYFESFKLHMRELGVGEPDVEPRATDHIGEIIRIVEGLVAKGFAYELGGDVYFAVAKCPQYGKLSKRHLDDLLAGARVDVDDRKRSPMDFALWKKAKEGEPSWPSPWGAGRPGWHIECSAMSSKYLGEQFDIHGGGQDLVFPHHENEIAQSECYSGKQFVKYWMHNGFVTVNKEKMSKSLGNFFAMKDILKQYRGPVVRIFLLSKHYRSPIDFCDEELREAQKNIERIENCIGVVQERIAAVPAEPAAAPAAQKSAAIAEFEAAMDDDFNTARALAAVFQLMSDLNVSMIKATDAAHLRQGLRDMQTILGVLGIRAGGLHIEKVPAGESASADGLDAIAAKAELAHDDIVALIKMRNGARKAKEWKTADRIRDELQRRKIVLRDEKDGTSYIKQ